MTLPKWAARRDDIEPLIVAALRRGGWGVLRLNAGGVPDILCGRGKHLFLAEVVGEAKAKKYRKTDGLTPAQEKFHAAWPGIIYKLRSVDEALLVAKKLMREAR